MRTVVYCRVSNLKDASLSFMSQEEECKKYCHEKKLRIKYIYKEHNSGFGKQRVLDNIILTNKDINLIIYDITRFSRSKLHGEKLLKICKKKNITIHFVKNNIVYKPTDNDEDDSLYQVLRGLSHSQSEWSTIRDRIVTSINFRRSRGMCLGKAPFGFDSIDKKLVPNDNFNAIRLIVGLRNGVKTIYEIRQILGKLATDSQLLSFYDENNKEITTFSHTLMLDFKTITNILNEYNVCNKHWIPSQVALLYKKNCLYEEFKCDTEFVNKFNNIRPNTRLNTHVSFDDTMMYEDN
jgi:DNA invertase Pin-like site-specific DNA recombinase